MNTEPMSAKELEVVVSLFAASWPTEPSYDEQAALSRVLAPYSRDEVESTLGELVAMHSSCPAVSDVMARAEAVRRRGALSGRLGHSPTRAAHGTYIDLAREALRGAAREAAEKVPA
jgi:hypothetical protein